MTSTSSFHEESMEDEVPEEEENEKAETELNVTEEDIFKMDKIFETINNQTKNIGQMVLDLTAKIEAADMQEEGLSFLSMKNHLLMDYLINLMNVISSKCSGESIADSPAVHKLVEIRTVLEKIRPIDHKMKYQIEKLTRAAVEGKSDSDPLQFKAKPDDLDRSDDSDDSDEDEPTTSSSKSKSEVYRPPKVVPQHFDDEEDEAKVVEKVKRKSINRTLIRELQEEFLDTPIEVHNMGDAYDKQLSHEVRDKQRYEEAYMTRLPVTKQEKHKQNKLSTLGTLGQEVTDFSRKRSAPDAGKKRKGKGKFGKGGKKKFRK